MPLLDALEHLPTVSAGHHHVEKNQLRLLLAFEDRQPLFGVAGLEHRIALELQARAHVLAHVLVVVDDEHGRACLLACARPGALEEPVEVGSTVPAVPARRVEGRHPTLVGPLSDRALGNAEILRRLAQRQPVRLGPGCPAPWYFAVGHSAWKLPKVAAT